MHETNVTSTVGDIVAGNPHTAAVFARHGIDFCCGGRRTIAAACAAHEIEPATLMAELSEVGNPAEVPDVLEWEVEELIDHILTRHHRYVRDQRPRIEGWLDKMVNRHKGSVAPEAAAVFKALAVELEQHMLKEEIVLFPYMKRLARSVTDGSSRPSAPFRSVAMPIAAMEHEHESAAKALARLRELTGDYTPPPEACATWRAAYAALSDFDADLRQHVHLENNVLFPAIMRLEQ